MSSKTPDRRAQRGAAQTEYGLIIALVGIAAIASLAVIGQMVKPSIEPSASTSPPATELIDDFNGVEGFAWKSVYGGWKLVGGEFVSTNDWSLTTAPVNASDYTFDVDLRTISKGPNTWNDVRAIVRYQDAGNFYAVVPKSDGGVELAKMQNGVWKPWLANANVGIDPLRTNHFTVKVNGNKVDVAVNGNPTLTYVDPDPVASGGIGITSQGAIGTADNARITIPK